MQHGVGLGLLLCASFAVVGCGSRSSSPGAPAQGLTTLPSEVLVSHNLDADASWSQVAAWNQQVYVVWLDERAGGLNVYFNRSRDGGATWQPTDTRIDHPPLPSVDAGPPQIACQGDLVVIVWDDDRNGHYDLFFNRSVDGGVTWQPQDTRLDTDLPGAADSGIAEVAVSDSAVYVTWTDERTGSRSVHFSASYDGGLTWPVSDLQIDGDTRGTIGSWISYVVARGSDVFVGWTDDRNDPGGREEAFGRSSVDGGQTWAPLARLSSSVPGSAHAFTAALARGGPASVYAMWEDDRVTGASGQAANVFFDRSVDGGASWGDPDRALTQNTSIYPVGTPHVCAWETRVFGVWTRLTQSPAPGYYLEDRRSDDEGQTWSSSGTNILPSTTPYSWVGLIGCACTADHVFVAWSDDHASVARDIYLNYARWNGSFATQAVRLNTPSPAASRIFISDLCTGGEAAYVVWQDDRNGYLSVFLNAARP